jgi:hypothetical protein
VENPAELGGHWGHNQDLHLDCHHLLEDHSRGDVGEFGHSGSPCIIPAGKFEGWGLSNAEIRALIDGVIDAGATPVARKIQKY